MNLYITYHAQGIGSEWLLEVLRRHPTARVVSDVGASMISGWGDIKEARYYAEGNILELIFC